MLFDMPSIGFKVIYNYNIGDLHTYNVTLTIGIKVKLLGKIFVDKKLEAALSFLVYHQKLPPHKSSSTYE